MLASVQAFFREWFAIASPFWRSEVRGRAFVLLASIVSLNLGGVGLNVMINEWNRRFFNALQEHNIYTFEQQLVVFMWLSAATILVAVYQTYLRQVLIIRWRRWLTNWYIERWLESRAYYRMQLADTETDNPDQRIAEDVNAFVNQSLGLTLDFLTSVVTLVTFSSILWSLSGLISVYGVVIPGYMVWVALIYAVVGSVLVAKIGGPLVRLNFMQQRVEADFRYSLVRLRENAEGIALYAGEEQEALNLRGRFGSIIGNFVSIIRQQRKLNFLSMGYTQFAVVFPFIVVSPRYFSGAIQLGELMQTASAFGAVQGALSWFVGAFSGFADLKARIDRLSSFGVALQKLGCESELASAKHLTSSRPGISIADVDIWLPDGTPVLENLRVNFPEGSKTLITGASGSGKSTLFRVIAGLWPYCNGLLTFPADERLLFLPQKPYLPVAKLRVVVTYPNQSTQYTDKEICETLDACGLSHIAHRLNDQEHWAQLLSGGEQQRLAIARALLLKPRWLFLDEATAQLDDPSEAQLYGLMVERLPDTGVVSISHHPALAVFHDVHLNMSRAKNSTVAELLPARSPVLQ